jgi:hypothetical protein
MNEIAFRRIGGRIVPIKKPTGAGKSLVSRRVAKGVIATGLSAAAGGALLKPGNGKSPKPNRFKLGLGYGLQVLSGAIAAAPVKGAARISAAIAGSVAADLSSSAMFASAIKDMRGDRSTKLKQFAKHQAIGTGVGYATFGAGLLANKSVRSKVIGWGSKIVRKVAFR